MNLDNYDLKLTYEERINVQLNAELAGGVCGTISAKEILRHFGIDISYNDIKDGIKDSIQNGTNQVNMVLFMSQYLE